MGAGFGLVELAESSNGRKELAADLSGGGSAAFAGGTGGSDFRIGVCTTAGCGLPCGEAGGNSAGTGVDCGRGSAGAAGGINQSTAGFS
jgi:hypothetical protein